MYKKIFITILAILIVIPIIEAATLTADNGISNSAPPAVFTYIYGNWSNTTIEEGSCSSTTCWGTGIEDVVALSGNEFFQEYHFNISNSSINISNIDLTFCFSACWSGGINGCGHPDEPEFDSSNGSAQVQIYNVSGSIWEDIAIPINLGSAFQSNAMTLTKYCKSKNSDFSDYVQNDILKLKINVSGDYLGVGADCEMFTDYVSLQISTPTPPSGKGGGGGGSSCIPNWQCGDWGKCDITGYKYRSCTDLNKCNVIDGLPDLSTECSPAELCFNGLRDSGEEGIDCGGVCKPCPVVEEPEPSPVVQVQPEVEMPALVPVCEPFEWPFWILYLFILVLSYFVVFQFNKIHLKFKKEYLPKIMIIANVLLFILVMLDLICSFRWYLVLLLVIIFLTICYLDKALNVHWLKTKRKRK